MSPKTLASALLRLSSTSSLIVPGSIVAEIGSEALQDALQRGWLRPNAETGFLTLTDQQTQINELRELAENPEVEPDAKTPMESASRAYATQHSTRLQETLGLGGGASTSGAPGSGQPGPTSAPPPA